MEIGENLAETIGFIGFIGTMCFLFWLMWRD